MKTNEENLKELLTIAVKNGWKIEDKCMLYFYKIQSNLLCFYRDANSDVEYFSTNDLVTNWEEGEVSFIEALCKHCQKTMDKEDFVKWSNSFRTHIDFYFEYEELEFLWNFKIDKKQRIDKRPTSERFSWLFDTFSHLF